MHRTTGLISYRRVKTGEPIEFCALPPLLALLAARRERLGPHAIYVLPELIFTVSDLDDPACNTKAWAGFKPWNNMKVPTKVAIRGAANGAVEVTAFLKHCGIKAPGITHKSFRKHNISFWASIGIKLKTRMRMAGHSKQEAHYRYDVPAEFEIRRAGDITWRYYESIMHGREFFIPTTPYDIYEALMARWAEFPAIIRSVLNENGPIGGQQNPIIEQTKILQAENMQLRAQLRDQEKRLDTIQAACAKLTKHFGLG